MLLDDILYSITYIRLYSIVTPSFYRSTARLQTTTPRMHGGGVYPHTGGGQPPAGGITPETF